MCCFSSIEKQSDQNLARGRGKFNIYGETISLQLTVPDNSYHLCNECLRKLQKRRGLRTDLRELDEEISHSSSSKACKAGLSLKKKAVQVHYVTAEKSVSPFSASNKGNRRRLKGSNNHTAIHRNTNSQLQDFKCGCTLQT